jgi:GTP-binding protein HflX
MDTPRATKGGGMRGPGETEIETDRRIVRDRIALLKDKIKILTNGDAAQIEFDGTCSISWLY